MTENMQISLQSRIFAQKAARSVVEMQPNINNTADIAILLECLGYRIEDLKEHGFADYHSLTNYIYNFLDMYEVRQKSDKSHVESFSAEIPSLSKRIGESFGLIFPWLASILLLFLTGVSLWMAIGFPIRTTTAFVTGVFFGVIITAGALQVTDRMFQYYFEQINLSEVKRLLKRSYFMLGIILLLATSVIYAVGSWEKIPLHLLTLTILSMVTVSFHRASYVLIYSLKKIRTIIIAYSTAFGILLFTYYLGQPLIQSGLRRYFVGLLLAFIALSIFSIYQHYKLKHTPKIEGSVPHFYKPFEITKKTIKSKFSVQLWEAMPFSLYGIFYFVMMFSDRIMSWFYNPVVLRENFGLPSAFNATYHIGADMALLVLLPASIVQYIMISPIDIKINNIAIRTTISQYDSINSFVRNFYQKILLVSMVLSIGTAVLLNVIAPPLMIHAGVTQPSIEILRIASIANIFMCLFATNGLFIQWLNGTKFLVFVSFISALLVITYGAMSDHNHLQNLTLGYLIATVFAASISSLYAIGKIKNAAKIIFARSF